MAERRVPRIRFKGFEEDWEQRELRNMFDFLQNNTLSRADLDVESGVARNVHYGDVLIKFGEYLDTSRLMLPYIPSQQIVDKFKGSLLQDGDVIMVDTAEDEAVGKCTEIAGLQGSPTISGLHTIPLRPREKFAPGYLGYYMNSDSYHDQLLPLMQGIKVTSVSKSAILNTDISYPDESNEQAEIGGFFIRLDCLLSLHQRKLEKLKILKKAMLEKMFPKNGAKVPEIRFSGFTEDWEQRKLGEMSSLITKGTTPLDKSNTGNVNFVNIESIDEASGEITITKKITNEEHDGYLRRSQLKENDILFSIAGTLGRVTSVKSSILPANTNQALAIIRRKTGDLQYVKTYLKGKVVSDYIKKNPTIGAQPNLSLEQVGNLEIALPILDEQKKIGEYFSGLNNLISLHQRKLEKLRQIKKSMLERMFV